MFLAAVQDGRPHWLLIDEAHHLLPAAREDVAAFLPKEIPAAIFITVHPDAVSPDALKTVECVVASARRRQRCWKRFSEAAGIAAPPVSVTPESDEVLVWAPNTDRAPFAVKAVRPKQSHRRHTRKYAAGDLGPTAASISAGPTVPSISSPHLMMFLQMAEGVDERTWMHHLRSGDYSRWFRAMIKDETLALEAATVESSQI